ncbi:MAG TPA: flagellar hook-length control protein FliK [Tepidisphaeraceae bacterium]|nr:flagellar hook-length control protein FliK [Tepidisphaeraceae bacterium]
MVAAPSVATSSAYAPAREGSFEQTLKSARKQNPAEKDDDGAVRAEKPAPKKPAKSTKGKRSVGATAGKRRTDESTDDVAEDQAASDSQTEIDKDGDVEDAASPTTDAPEKHDEVPKAAVQAQPALAVAQAPVTEALPGPAADGKTTGATGTEATTAAAQQKIKAVAAKASADAKVEDADSDAENAEPDATDAVSATDGAKIAKSANAPTSPAGIELGTSKVKSAGLVTHESANPDAANAAASSAAAAAAAPAVSSDDLAATISSALDSVTSSIDGGDSSASSRHASTNVDGGANVGPFEQVMQREISTMTAAKAQAPDAMPPEARFVDVNHPAILSGIHSQLLPNGGTMQIRLDPPELGALQVTVHMRDGIMTAAFETSNDDATRMLSHSLNELKSMLEAGGVNVERMHVQQAPRPESHGSGSDQQQQRGGEEQSGAKQEQQRRALLQRMWRKLTNGSDPLDLVA